MYDEQGYGRGQGTGVGRRKGWKNDSKKLPYIPYIFIINYFTCIKRVLCLCLILIPFGLRCLVLCNNFESNTDYQ